MLPRKGDSDGSAYVRCADKGQFRMVNLCDMLDDGQPQARATGLPGVTLIHPVEALEHMWLMLNRNANAGIGYRAGNASILL